MRNWWTTVGAVALCAAAAPSAWAAKAPARHTSASSLRGHQSADDAKASRTKKADTRKSDARKTTPSKKEAAAEKACAAAKTRAAKAKLCPKDGADEDTVAVGTLPDARGKVSELTPAPEKVGKGDTLYAISRRTGVSVDDLIELNKLKKPYHVRVGATLKLPKTRAYVVHSGDTLSGVAVRFGLDTDVLAAFNSFSADTPIRTGQKIYLPPNAEDKAPKLKPTPAKPAERPASPKPRPAVTRPTPPPVREPEPAPVEEEPAPAPAPVTPTPPPAEPYRPPAQTGSYPGATALPPVRGQATAPQTTAPQATTPQATTPQETAPQPSVRKPAPDSGRKPAPQASRPAPQPERPTANPPEESSGFQMIPAPSQTPPNARPTYGERPTPQTTPPPAQTYRPPASNSRPAIIQTNPAPTQSQVATAGRGRFIWPVRGNVLSGFGLKANGQKNDGLNISVTVGEPVRAAAAGEVVYAGDQVPSFGNLVLIKHSNGWVTAYAHLGRIAVSNRDQVTQGQQIGVGGQTGAVDQPQLHFEIRYAASPADKALPVDPSLVLPER